MKLQKSYKQRKRVSMKARNKLCASDVTPLRKNKAIEHISDDNDPDLDTSRRRKIKKRGRPRLKG